ncbi:MAG: folate family ECF transporter S component [Clostridiales Family XIII bacterium]|nr:folate family ECF transporter S component [Clostridiales Family XIII bacterium]
MSVKEFFAVKGVFTTKHIAVMAMLLAVRAISGFFPLTIYLNGTIKVFTLAHIVDAICAMFFGPIAGFVFGFAGDFLGYVASQGAGGAYAPWYAISEMATCFLFALFLYKRPVTWLRTIIPSVLNLGIVFLGLNTLWLNLYIGAEATLAALPFRVGLNAAMTPVYIVILWFVLTRIKAVVEKHKLL